ncbi:DMT family transporter [Thioclava sp. L04-15]|uniref:DMT family transporter n=1 Tax=Thioclava sp. L04-15 TaxID=1915318 RepID=UPI001FED3A88|nr:DMT family transporter [Thioclava sp. L04-15]
MDIAPIRTILGAMRLFALTALVMIAFASNSVLNRMAVHDAGWGPAETGFVRLSSGALVLLALAIRAKGTAGLRMPPAILGTGVATLSLYIFGFSIASGLIDAGVGALTLFGMVQITMFAGALWMREPISLWRWIGAGLAFAGLAVLLLPASGGADIDPRGFGLMALGGVGWGLYSLNGRRVGIPLTATALNFALAAPLALIWMLGVGDWGQGASWGWWPAILSGAVTSGLGYALWYRVLPQIPASLAAIAQLSVPLLAALGGAVLLAEIPSARFWLSAALVIGGIALSLRRKA